jgi:hypothetical protein
MAASDGRGREEKKRRRRSSQRKEGARTVTAWGRVNVMRVCVWRWEEGSRFTVVRAHVNGREGSCSGR